MWSIIFKILTIYQKIALIFLRLDLEKYPNNLENIIQQEYHGIKRFLYSSLKIFF